MNHPNWDSLYNLSWYQQHWQWNEYPIKDNFPVDWQPIVPYARGNVGKRVRTLGFFDIFQDFKDYLEGENVDAGATSEMFRNPETSRIWIYNNTIAPNPRIPDSVKAELTAKLNEIAQLAERVKGKNSEGAALLWSQFGSAARNITDDQKFLNIFVVGSEAADAAPVYQQQAEDAGLDSDGDKKPQSSVLPLALIGGIGLYLFMSKKK